MNFISSFLQMEKLELRGLITSPGSQNHKYNVLYNKIYLATKPATEEFLRAHKHQ